MNEKERLIILRNVPVRGEYLGMGLKEVIIWGIQAVIISMIAFTRDSAIEGLAWMIFGGMYIWFLKYLFSARIIGRVAYIYFVDIFRTFFGLKQGYFHELKEEFKHGDSEGFTFTVTKKGKSE